jgi:sigma-B regulation protein RsbU (phosphoserine phosphatase)
MFATVFVATIDPDTGEVEYANGGHEPPVVLRAGGGTERLDPTGPAVGLLPGSRFEVATVRLAIGDTLIAFTDGVTEARAPSGELYSEERLMASLDDPARTADESLDRIEADLGRHVFGGPQSDDVTLLAVRRDGAAAEDQPEIEEGAA